MGECVSHASPHHSIATVGKAVIVCTITGLVILDYRVDEELEARYEEAAAHNIGFLDPQIY
jgi:hypothetical protein